MADRIETRYLNIATDLESLRDFIERAERDLAGGSPGVTSAWPEMRTDMERAVKLARAQLAEAQ